MLAQMYWVGPACAQARDQGMEREEQELLRKFIDAEKERHLGNYDASVNLFLECISIDKEHDASYFGLGKVYLEQSIYSQAEQFFEKATALDKDNRWYWLSWSQALIAQEKYAEASDNYKQLHKRYPEDVQIHLDYANTLLFAGKARKALKEFDSLEDRIGSSHEISRRKYEYFIGHRKYDDAAEEIEKLLKIYPEDHQLYGMLAELYKAQGKIDKAIVIYEKASREDPTNAYIQLSLAEFYERDGQYDTAYHYLKMAYQNPNLDIDTKVGVLLKMYPQAERHERIRKQALELARLVVETHPEEAKSYSLYGDFLSLDNQREEARDQYKKAVEIDPSRFPVWNQILFIDSELDDQQALLEDSEAALEYFPAQPMVYFFHGIANIQMEQYADAVKSLKTGSLMVIGNQTLSVQILANLGDAYHELGRHQSSDSAYEASLSYDSNNAYVLNNYSYFLSLRGENLERAKEMSERSLEHDPNNASYLDTYGWILFRLGEFEEAAVYLKRAVENGASGSAEVLEHYGDVLYELGLTEEALEHWKRAKAAGAEGEGIDYKITTGKIGEE